MPLDEGMLRKLPIGEHEDGNGLFLRVVNGGTHWRLTRYWVYYYGTGRWKSLGSLSRVNLHEARGLAKATRSLAPTPGAERTRRYRERKRLAAPTLDEPRVAVEAAAARMPGILPSKPEIGSEAEAIKRCLCMAREMYERGYSKQDVWQALSHPQIRKQDAYDAITATARRDAICIVAMSDAAFFVKVRRRVRGPLSTWEAACAAFRGMEADAGLNLGLYVFGHGNSPGWPRIAPNRQTTS